jgi:hypothetical protein
MSEKMEFGAGGSIFFSGVKPILSSEGGRKYLLILWSFLYRVRILYND